MNYQEIVEILKDKLDSVSDFAYQEYNSEELGLGKVKQILEANEGGEGKGEHWIRVFYFIDHDIYIRVEGYYQSYNGTEFYNEWGSLDQVKPKEVLQTIYQSV